MYLSSCVCICGSRGASWCLGTSAKLHRQDDWVPFQPGSRDPNRGSGGLGNKSLRTRVEEGGGTACLMPKWQCLSSVLCRSFFLYLAVCRVCLIHIYIYMCVCVYIYIYAFIYYVLLIGGLPKYNMIHVPM